MVRYVTIGTAIAIACSACAPALPLREASHVHVQQLRHGYVLVSDDDGREIPERDFARMYKARTGSTEIDWTDHPHLAMTVAGLMMGGASSAVSLIATGAAVGDARGHQSSETPMIYAGFFGATAAIALVCTLLHAVRGSPEDHDLPRDRAETLVERYNTALGQHASGGSVSP